MAASKEYAYFIKGNKLSLVERDFSGTGSGLNYTYSAADGIELPSGGGTWKSPLTSVTNGIQIEYTHGGAYEFTHNSFVGFAAYASLTDTTGTIAESTVVGSSTKGLYAIAAEGISLNWGTYLSAGDYIVVRGDSALSGLHRVHSFQDYGGTNRAIILDTRYPSSGTSQRSGSLKVYYDVKPLIDEDSEIQIPRYKAVAVSYYIKARILEDMGKLKESEYFMAKFFKHLERHDDAKVWSLRQVMPGGHAIR